MKSGILAIVCIVSSISFEVGPHPGHDGPADYSDPDLLEQICDLPLEEFIEKPVKSLLDFIEPRIESHTPTTEPPAVLIGYFIRFSDRVYLVVRVNDFKHIEPFNIEYEWDFNLFLEEAISQIVVYSDGEIVYDSALDEGCNI